jgi:hypothetical protein
MQPVIMIVVFWQGFPESGSNIMNEDGMFTREIVRIKPKDVQSNYLYYQKKQGQYFIEYVSPK